MIIKEALRLTLLGMGIVFLVLAIDYFSILVIRIFKKEEQRDFEITLAGVESGLVVKEEPPSLVTLTSGRVPHAEIEAAIIAAICAWEAEEEKTRGYL